MSTRFGAVSVNHNRVPAPIPTDATRATEHQRDVQEKLDHRDDDPDAPGRWQTRQQIPDET
ncbi:MAG: hypothetical protein AB7G47_09615 [Mycolicibacterium sp.]